VLGEAGAEEEVLVVDVDPAVALQWRRSFPVLTDRVL